ncbi:hypothetical protein O7621_24295 [Solwaraspora sp. WMMD937]|uniref:hypothetical protein n=1 Tax=Solwaraspora sp. WMMD937 TaxID=3016090 RepID=UPI00249AD771|nr:hypothetical protein [Solwaraspora sp. WMMD937]WFE20957.1 hypothetical protein O7621_24295 [Solwaraspora sp. WMMD937]
MPLEMPEPPSGVRDRIRSRMRTFADASKFSTKALRNARKDQLELSNPHQIYVLGLDDIIAGNGLDSAQPVGWRYLIEEAGQPIASAETASAADGTEQMSQFTEGPFVASTNKALKGVLKLATLRTGRYELRLLRVPALYVMALWLHLPRRDLIIPLEPSPVGKEDRVVPADEFLSDLTEKARTMLPPDPSEAPGTIPGS